MKIKDLCVEERPREKMLMRGAGALTNAELLAILLRIGTGGRNVVDVARELLKAGGEHLREIAAMPVEKLSGTGRRCDHVLPPSLLFLSTSWPKPWHLG